MALYAVTDVADHTDVADDVAATVDYFVKAHAVRTGLTLLPSMLMTGAGDAATFAYVVGVY